MRLYASGSQDLSGETGRIPPIRDTVPQKLRSPISHLRSPISGASSLAHLAPPQSRQTPPDFPLSSGIATGRATWQHSILPLLVDAEVSGFDGRSALLPDGWREHSFQPRDLLRAAIMAGYPPLSGTPENRQLRDWRLASLQLALETSRIGTGGA